MLKTFRTTFLLCIGALSGASGQVSLKEPAYAADKGADELVLKNPAGDTLLAYRYTVKPPPPGVDGVYGRSGYIHPLKTLSGHVLTRIQPADHYHHYGIWNPWTRVAYKGKVYDLWNIGDKQGTVRFVKFADIFQNEHGAGFEAVHDHVVFEDGREIPIIREHWRIAISQLDANRYQCDIRSTFAPVGAADVTLQTYRYGGLVFRATEAWTNANSDVLTSSGKNRDDADGSSERWAIVSGNLGEEQGGILFLSYPENYNFPEPVRVWPADANDGRGDQFFNFSPTKNKDWVLHNGKTYTLRYRLVVFDGVLSREEAEQLWETFAAANQDDAANY